MYFFRFMIGFFESGFSPIIIFLLGSWYTKAELAKRIAIWHITGFFGAATSAFLQAGVHATLNGRLGLAGWRWLNIICGCISLPVAISVWFLLPDHPHNTQAWYITEKDKELDLRRNANVGKVAVTGTLDLKLVKRMFGSWRWWTLCLMYIFHGNSCQANSYFAIFLRSAGFSEANRNIIPATQNLVSMITDSLGATGLISLAIATGSTILSVWPADIATKVVAFYFVGGYYVTSVVWTWANEINNGNAEERALTISSMNGLFYATNSFLPILIFPQTMAPSFRFGFPSILTFALCSIILVTFVNFMHKRELRLASQSQDSLLGSERRPDSAQEMDDTKEMDDARKNVPSI